ncbi:putative oxidoreductase [Shimia gijangensis]|uniref:Putative oxidoreductase n=1 Tax=Shimia gijangensis TaxID=1470563 RepID=A0A1M6DWZ4_9RHOB|nr:DoxX family protein [Shimia gijangensis]SHI77538.1 putative oxidoreductase [Shimia gijangensis]
MNALISLHNSVFSRVNRVDWLLPTLARFVFAAVLVGYYWHSGLTKLGNGILGLFQPSVGAYVQIFPRALEAAGYDTSQLSVFHWAIVTAGTWAEFILPVMIVLGLLTRLSALGMIGFVVLQSLTDIVGHHADAVTVGAWFDRFENSAIMDQRAFWVFLLVVLVVKGAGPLSVDAILARRTQSEM